MFFAIFIIFIISILYIFSYYSKKDIISNSHISSNIPNTLKQNLILIVMDTTRADHLSCYGYFKKLTPNLDEIAKRGILFKNCISVVSWTLPSHASIFTGNFSSEHGATSKHQYLEKSNLTLAEILAKNGYLCMGFSGNSWVSSTAGMNQGFHFFDDNFDKLGPIKDTNHFFILMF